MGSLRLKLILTFLIVSITGTLLAALIVRQSNERAFEALLREQGRNNFVRDARIYYENWGTWTGFAQSIRDRLPAPVPGQPPVPLPPFALAGADGRIIVANGPFRRGNLAPPDALRQGIPLELEGNLIGTVLPVNQRPPRNPEEEAFEIQTNRALLIGAAGATLAAVILAIFMARTLTRPLRELAAASRAMAQGDLRQQVPVRTQDELGALAAAFNQMSADLAQANEKRRQMTADIAHELRTPLTVLSGYLESMRDGTLKPTPERLALMDQEVYTLKRLVSDLRTLSLADAGELSLQREAVVPAELLQQVAAAYQHQAQRQAVTLSVSAASPLPDINVDPARMSQVLGNLVSNGLRYTPAGGTITLAAGLAPDTNAGVQLTVADTGAGIPAADLPHIFDRFYRGDKSRRQTEGESGLGLAIARSLVLAHGGTIDVESRPGQGTTFAITLPAG